jgi:hypothetical protein
MAQGCLRHPAPCTSAKMEVALHFGLGGRLAGKRSEYAYLGSVLKILLKPNNVLNKSGNFALNLNKDNGHQQNIYND